MTKRFIILIFIFGVVVRLWYLLYPVGRGSFITVDEAVYGVQSLLIANGERPVFYPAQVYTGSLSGYLTAFLFTIFGFYPLFLKVIPFLSSVLLIWSTYKFSKIVFNDDLVSFLVLVWSCLGTPFLNNWSGRAGTGYVEVSLIGTWLLILTVKLRSSEVSSRKALIISFLGFLSGLGFWVQPTVVYYLLPVLFYLIVNYRDLLRNRLFYLGSSLWLFGFLLGSSPVILFNLNHQSATANTLLKMPWGVKTAFFRLITEGMPVILGVRTSNSLKDFSTSLSLIIQVTFLFSGLYFAYKSVKGFYLRFLYWYEALVPQDLVFLVFVSTIGIFLLSTPFNQFSIEPRYTLSLYSTLPLILAYFLARIRRFSLVIFLLILFSISLNWVLGLVSAGPLTFNDPYRVEEVAEFLRRRSVNYVITEPALGARIMFYSNLSVLAAVRGGGITEWRFPKINREVITARDRDNYKVGFVSLKGSPFEADFEREINRFVGENFERQTVSGVFSVLIPQPQR